MIADDKRARQQLFLLLTHGAELLYHRPGGTQFPTMKTITLITGAAKGIGFEAARMLAKEGHHVLVGARDQTKGNEAAEKLESEGLPAAFLSLDVDSENSIAKAVEAVQQIHGRLDVLINNAAILLDHYQGAEGTIPDDMERTLATNVVGVHSVIRAFLPLLRQSPAARIVNVSSGAGQLNDMFGSVWAPGYQVSKAALNALTRIWATELVKDHIPVNSVCPGWCRTDMGGEQASRTAEQGATSVCWLVTRASKDITGKFFRDGVELEW